MKIKYKNKARAQRRAAFRRRVVANILARCLSRVNKKLDAVRRAFLTMRQKVLIFKSYLGGCVDCGFNAHPAALDFDHLPAYSKRANVSRLIKKGWGAILDEIAKCELVCANCHRIRTATRLRVAA